MKNSLYTNFNFSVLEDPRYNEESVREELISPLIRYLGYGNSGDTQVIRNHGLKHPFISVGSSKRKIRVIPDYLMKVNEKPAWVLEAKSPLQQINLSAHAEQAYSYAIHPEIRVNYFALCNGRDFLLYNISQAKPMVQIPLQAIDQYKEYISKILAPSNIFSPRDYLYSKDLGLHIKRIGFTTVESVIILCVRPGYIIKYNDNLFSFPAPIGIDGTTYMGSFDFNLDTAHQLQPILGPQNFSALLKPVTTGLLKFHFDEDFRLNIRISLPEKEALVENEREIYLPLTVKEFISI
jgi:hypothetical protein